MWQSIATVIQLIPRVLDLFDRLGNFIKEKNIEAYIANLEKTVEKLEKAQTPEDKRSVARDVVGLIRRM